MKEQKSVRNRLFKTEKVELESHKVELAIGDELRNLASKTGDAFDKVNKELDDAFEPIRRIEKISESIPSKLDSFKAFTSVLQKMEQQFQDDNQKLKSAEQELGVKIPRPKALDQAVRQLEQFQRQEEIFRREINEFNKASKKYR